MTIAYPLLTSRLSIRPLQVKDIDAFVGYRQDPNVARFQSWNTTFSRQDGLDLLRSQVGVMLPEPGEWIQLGIHHRLSGELLGDVAVHTRDHTRKSYEIGFTLAPTSQGRGYAREAVRTVLRVLFSEAGAQEVIATCDSRNERSISLLRALGFGADASRGWTENVKGETVTVDFFRLTHPRTPRVD